MNKILLLSIISISQLFAGLIHPPDDSELNYVHILFRWEAENNFSYYEFELSKSEDFTSVLINDIVNDTIYSVTKHIDWQSTYYWRIIPLNDGLLEINDDWLEEINSFSTKQPSYMFSEDISALEILNNNSDSTFKGITIYGMVSPFYSAAIDMDGNEVWNSGGVDTYSLLNINNDHEFTGSYVSSGVREFGTEFTIEKGIDDQWHEPITDITINFLQHEMIKLSNGNYMGFVPDTIDHYVPNSDDYSQFPPDFNFTFENNIPGFGDFPYPWKWKGEKIVEWDREGNEIWSWSPFDTSYGYNLNDFDFINLFWEETQSNPDKPPFDWTHFNALAYDEDENTVYVSSKNLSRITKIDYITKEIIWNMGKQWLGDTTTIRPDILFSGQHGLQLLENGNIVIFDNGIMSGYIDGSGEYLSRALELKVSQENNEYISETIWSFTLPLDLYGTISGSVQKLENENYLITTVGSSDGAHSLEVTQSGNIVWDCKYNVGTPQGAIYRAMRTPALYQSEYQSGNSSLDIDTHELPQHLQLKSIYPNPFNPIINIEYELPAFASIQFGIYNIKGQQIDRIKEGYKSPGIYSIIWNGKNYPSGIYFIVLENQSKSLIKKIVLLK